MEKPLKENFDTARAYLAALNNWREETGNMNNMDRRRERRADRLEERAAKKMEKSNQDWDRHNELSEPFQNGQPILVGHHSEKKARRLQERMHNAARRSMVTRQEAEHLAVFASSVRNNTSISSNDEDAIAKLEAKIEDAVEKQEMMKAANKIIRNKNLTDAEKHQQLEDNGFDAESVLTPDCHGGIGFARYYLANNNANINRMRKRVEQLKRMAERTVESTKFKVVKHFHSKRRIDIFIATSRYRVPREVFCELREKAESLGGWWSKSWRGSPAGFAFEDEESANEFANIQEA